MEIPNGDAYAAAGRGSIRHYGSCHPDGTSNYEIKCVTLRRLSASAEFTDDVLSLLVDKGGPIHSYPAIMPELVGSVTKIPEEFCEKECRPRDRDKALACGKWLGKHKEDGPPCMCYQCKSNRKHRAGDWEACGSRDSHEKEVTLCGTNMCWHHLTKTDYIRGGEVFYITNPRRDSEDWVMRKIAHPLTPGTGVWKVRDESFAFSRSTSSNHLHFSPVPGYTDFRKLFWLTRLYQQFFCNSPIRHEGRVLLSLRRAGLPSEGPDWPSRGSYGNGYLIPRSQYTQSRNNHNLTSNSLGTIEFRYNDLSKSPQTVLFYGYLAILAPHVPWEALPKRVGFKDFDYQYRKFEPDMMAFTECIGDVAGRARFWNVYTRDHVGWAEMVRSMTELEMGAFEKFTTVSDWSDFWAEYLGSDIPLITVPGKIGTGEPEVAASIEALGGSHWDRVAAFNEAAGEEEAYI